MITPIPPLRFASVPVPILSPAVFPALAVVIGLMISLCPTLSAAETGTANGATGGPVTRSGSGNSGGGPAIPPDGSDGWNNGGPRGNGGGPRGPSSSTSGNVFTATPASSAGPSLAPRTFSAASLPPGLNQAASQLGSFRQTPTEFDGPEDKKAKERRALIRRSQKAGQYEAILPAPETDDRVYIKSRTEPTPAEATAAAIQAAEATPNVYALAINLDGLKPSLHQQQASTPRPADTVAVESQETELTPRASVDAQIAVLSRPGAENPTLLSAQDLFFAGADDPAGGGPLEPPKPGALPLPPPVLVNPTVLDPPVTAVVLEVVDYVARAFDDRSQTEQPNLWASHSRNQTLFGPDNSTVFSAGLPPAPSSVKAASNQSFNNELDELLGRNWDELADELLARLRQARAFGIFTEGDLFQTTLREIGLSSRGYEPPLRDGAIMGRSDTRSELEWISSRLSN